MCPSDLLEVIVRHRKQDVQQYGQLYKKLDFASPKERWSCFYCNEPMAGYDHQPPITQIGYMLLCGDPFEAYLVPCCSECNSLLSDTVTLTLADRMRELKDRLRKKYRSQMRIAGQWTYDEIKELGHSLRGMVLASAKEGRVAEYRILYPGHGIKEEVEMVDPSAIYVCESCGFVDKNATCPACGKRNER